MPRPKSFPPTSGPRSHSVETRVSAEERETIARYAAARHRSVADYLRLLALGHETCPGSAVATSASGRPNPFLPSETTISFSDPN